MEGLADEVLEHIFGFLRGYVRAKIKIANRVTFLPFATCRPPSNITKFYHRASTAAHCTCPRFKPIHADRGRRAGHNRFAGSGANWSRLALLLAERALAATCSSRGTLTSA